MAVATLSVCRWLLPCGMRRHIITHPWWCECLYWTAYRHFRLGRDSASTLVLGEKRHRIGRQPCGHCPTIRLPVLLHPTHSHGSDRVFRITCSPTEPANFRKLFCAVAHKKSEDLEYFRQKNYEDLEYFQEINCEDLEFYVFLPLKNL